MTIAMNIGPESLRSRKFRSRPQYLVQNVTLTNIQSDNFAFEEADVPSGQPLIADVIKQLVRRGGPPRAEQMMLLVKNCASGYSASGRGCSFSTLVGYAVTMARLTMAWIEPDPGEGEGFIPQDLFDVWTVGVPWLQMVGNAVYWRSQLVAANSDWFHSSGLPSQAQGRIFFPFPISDTDDQAAPNMLRPLVEDIFTLGT